MKFAVIGLGSFGFYIAKTLYELGHEVVAIDEDKTRVDVLKDLSTRAIHMDAADKENLQAVGIRNMDVVVVSLGPAMESSILTTLFLSEMGVERIIAKALTEDHAKILDAVGATDVIYPEKDMAVKTALRLSNPNILEYLPLVSGLRVQEIAAPEKFIGKSLRELDLRNKYGILVMAIKELIPEQTTFMPKADFILKDSDILIILGEEEQLKKLDSKNSLKP